MVTFLRKNIPKRIKRLSQILITVVAVPIQVLTIAVKKLPYNRVAGGFFSPSPHTT
jgi:hypothetical protein